MKLAFIGTGYVGLVNGTVMADAGNSVVCVDKDVARIEMLNRQEMPIYEPGLAELLRQNVSAGRLKFSTSLEDAVKSSDVLFVCVGTPSSADGYADVSSVFDVGLCVAELVKKNVIGYRLLVIKSTVPPTTTDKVQEATSKIVSVDRLELVMNPEFLQEGIAVQNAMRPDRIVVGARSHRAREILKELFLPFTKSGAPIRVDYSPTEAELVKYVSNSRLASQLSFQNECAVLCDAFGANIRKVLDAVTDDKRIGKKFMHPSGGYGGSCFPKDVKALVYAAKNVGVDLSVAKAADTSNERMKQYLLDKIDLYFADGVVGKTFAVWGLAFKAGTDDAREAPSLTIIDGLLKRGASVKAYDPQAMNFVRHRTSIGERIAYVGDAQQALIGADALVICTEWPEFSSPDFVEIKNLVWHPVIFDNKSLFEPGLLDKLGFAYFGIGVENDLARSYRKLGK